MDTTKVRITAKDFVFMGYAVMFMGKKVVLASDSGARVGNGIRMISGEIDCGGRDEDWYCEVSKGSVFELEVDTEFYRKNKHRIKKWDIEEIEYFSMSEERSKALRIMEEGPE